MSATGLKLRAILASAGMALLAACTVIPKGQVAAPPPPAPSPTALPADVGRHRVALLVPLTGSNANVGQAIANATTMALLDTNAENLRITTYDTSAGAPQAAARAVADGNKLILGPLLRDEALAVAATARAAHVPVISYSNDSVAAGGDVFVMGNIPAAAIERVVKQARAMGAVKFGAMIPVGTYGERGSRAVMAAVKAAGGTLVGMESYDAAPGKLGAAARRLKARGAIDAVLVADNARVAVQIAPILRPGGTGPRLLGTELWAGDAALAQGPALVGSLYAAVSDARFARFADSYKTRFGTAPYRLATLGYDSVLLTLRIAREWKPGTPFPTAKLTDRSGFLGLDGAFRFGPDEVVERALEVRQVKAGGASAVVSPAAARFEG
ncbi:MAG: penicillin-binding protein activator [Proteobacteria bacterium]|nr:penicillin-binding protein activator [Pseudomonadota bacterium]